MVKRSPSLEHTLGAALAALAVLSGTASVSLVVITRALHRTNLAINAAVERHEMTGDAARDLVSYEQAHAPALRDRFAHDIRARLDDLVEGSSSDSERDVAVRARRETEARLEGRGTGGAAEHALDELGAMQRTSLDARRAGARQLHDGAQITGLATAFIVMMGTALLLVALNRRVVRPLLGVAKAMHRFGRGDASVRALERGPREVVDMAREFNRMAERLEAQEASYRVYLSSVAHDLRNPVHVLRGAVSLDSAIVSEPVQMKRILGIVERQLGQIERLVDDVVDTENLRQGHLTIHPSTNDVCELARSATTLFAKASNAHSIELVAPHPVVLSCDAARIEEVLTNLLSNAIKYSPRGGTIRVEVGASCAKARITVTDEGIGMTEKQAEEIFGPFARGVSEKDKIPGRGLGLFVARRIVEEHGGTIGVDTVLGRGSSFIVELPLDGVRATNGTQTQNTDLSEARDR